jgi:GNAT superfamily N-acetyltransferase
MWKAIGTSWSRFQGARREFGLPYVAYAMGQMLCRPGLLEFRSIRVFVLDREAVPRPVGDDDPAIEEITDAALNGLEIEETVGWRRRLRRGYRLWVLWDGDKIVAYDWQTGLRRYLAPWIRLIGASGDQWGCYLHVAADRRGEGLGPRLRSHVLRASGAAGVHRFLGMAAAPNRNSQRALAKLGYRLAGRLFYIRILGLAIVRHGKKWRRGRWDATQPLEIGVDSTFCHRL